MGRPKGSKNSKRPVEKVQEVEKKETKITQYYNNPAPTPTKDELEFEYYKRLVFKNEKDNLINLTLRMFKWNIPEELREIFDEKIIEWGLLKWGQVTFYRDPLWGLDALPSVDTDLYNQHGKPLFTQVMGYNGYNATVKIQYFKDYPQMGIFPIDTSEGRYGIVCEDNYNKKIYMDFIEQYAHELADYKVAMYVSAQRLKDPFILAIKEKAAGKNAKKLIRSVKDNRPDILFVKDDVKTIGGGKLSDIIELVDLKGNPDSSKRLVEMYNATLNYFLTLIGINSNPNPDKTEYNNIDETNANNGLINRQYELRLHCREEACKKIKKVLGVDISVEKNVEEVVELANNMKNSMKGENDNGNEKASENSR